MNNTNEVVITSFYHFKNLPYIEETKENLLKLCKSLDLKGTILLASEGINATIAGSRASMDQFYSYLLNDLDIAVNNFKESFADFQPFLKMKVRLKREIVAMGVYDLDSDKYRGEYVTSASWDELLEREDVVVIDTRNRYEVKLGSFKDAVNPDTKTFREFPDWVDNNRELLKDKKIAMFCTGGVRCEKSTAFLKRQGYNEVYHLQGGIIKYLEETENKHKFWQGNCFVFDDRVALNDALAPADDLVCSICDANMSTDDVRDTSAYKRVVCIKCHNEEKALKNDRK